MAQASSPFLPFKYPHKDLSPKYLLIAAIPSSSSQGAFFPSANTIFHQIKTLLPGGNQFPVCNLLSHILPLLCYDHPTLFSFLHHNLHIVHLLIQLFMVSSAKIQSSTFASSVLPSISHSSSIRSIFFSHQLTRSLLYYFH